MPNPLSLPKVPARHSARRGRLVRAAIALMAVAAVGGASTGAAAPGDGAGSLLAFGNNYYGQLGSATNNLTENPNPTPAPLTLPGQIGTATQIAAGSYHSLAVTSSGQLYAFGLNYYGQLGNATNNSTFIPNPTPTPVALPGQIGTVTQSAAGCGPQPGGDLERPALRLWRATVRSAWQHRQQQHRQPESDADAGQAARPDRHGHAIAAGRASQPGGDLERPALRLRPQRSTVSSAPRPTTPPTTRIRRRRWSRCRVRSARSRRSPPATSTAWR